MLVKGCSGGAEPGETAVSAETIKGIEAIIGLGHEFI